MKWHNLRENKCPECSKDLDWSAGTAVMFTCVCGFKISEKRFREITGDMTTTSVNKYYGDKK